MLSPVSDARGKYYSAPEVWQPFVLHRAMQLASCTWHTLLHRLLFPLCPKGLAMFLRQLDPRQTGQACKTDMQQAEHLKALPNRPTCQLITDHESPAKAAGHNTELSGCALTSQ